jgi:hypothetical protein
MADGTVLFIPEDFSPDMLSSMTTINGGEVLPENFLE